MSNPRLLLALSAIITGGVILALDVLTGDKINEAMAAVAVAFTTAAVAIGGGKPDA